MRYRLYNIDKFDGNNYDGWKIHMKSVLIHCELWQYVSGSLVKGETDTAAVRAEWDAKDAKALASITLSMKTSMSINIKNCATSKTA